MEIDIEIGITPGFLWDIKLNKSTDFPGYEFNTKQKSPEVSRAFS